MLKNAGPYENAFQFIQREIDIEDVITRITAIDGKDMRLRCPSCKNVKIRIEKDKNCFYCSECKKAGDPTYYVAERKKCSPIEAAQFIIDEFFPKGFMPKELMDEIGLHESHKYSNKISPKLEG
jgi:DNA primase